MRTIFRTGVPIVLAIGALLLQGCATLFTNSTETVQITSEPSGANYEYGPFSGKTPDSIAVPKKSIADFATFSMPGYERRTITVDSGIAGVFWLDVLFWPAVLVDVATGDFRTLSVNQISATLTPIASNDAPRTPMSGATTPPGMAPASLPPTHASGQ
jgi:hypothetical protein